MLGKPLAIPLNLSARCKQDKENAEIAKCRVLNVRKLSNFKFDEVLRRI